MNGFVWIVFALFVCCRVGGCRAGPGPAGCIRGWFVDGRVGCDFVFLGRGFWIFGSLWCLLCPWATKWSLKSKKRWYLNDHLSDLPLSWKRGGPLPHHFQDFPKYHGVEVDFGRQLTRETSAFPNVNIQRRPATKYQAAASASSCPAQIPW